MPLPIGRSAWIQLARGSAMLDGVALHAGDGVAVTEASAFTLQGTHDTAEALIFDLA